MGGLFHGHRHAADDGCRHASTAQICRFILWARVQDPLPCAAQPALVQSLWAVPGTSLLIMHRQGKGVAMSSMSIHLYKAQTLPPRAVVVAPGQHRTQDIGRPDPEPPTHHLQAHCAGAGHSGPEKGAGGGPCQCGGDAVPGRKLHQRAGPEAGSTVSGGLAGPTSLSWGSRRGPGKLILGFCAKSTVTKFVRPDNVNGVPNSKPWGQPQQCKLPCSDEGRLHQMTQACHACSGGASALHLLANLWCNAARHNAQGNRLRLQALGSTA